MNKRLSLAVLLMFSIIGLKGQCSNDTIFSDVVFMIDNSGSIDSAEFDKFSNIILASVNKVQATCPKAQVGVVHYGGFEGKETEIEYDLSKTNTITSIDRQFCTALDMFDNCLGGGGDDLNYAVGEVITFIGDGTLDHDTKNNLKLVIFTDAFDGSPTCGLPNCSVLKPFTNIDILKSTYSASVTVVGVLPQANPALLQIYASPGGSYDTFTLDDDCAGTFDGCVQPRKFIPITYNSDEGITSDSVASCADCEFEIVAGMMVDAGNMTMICSDLPQSASLTAEGSIGTPPYAYSWSNGGSTQTISVSPSVDTWYYVTATDINNCFDVDSVLVKTEICCDNLSVEAGDDHSICGNLGESANLLASATGSGAPFSYNWDNGLGSGAAKTVSPSSTTTYTVTATDNLGCTAVDMVTVNVNVCCAGFSASLGPDVVICGDIPESTSITVIPSGGTAPYSYTWDNGLANQASHIVMPAVTTTYSVTVTDDAGCTSNDQITVVVDVCGPDCEPDTTYTDVIFLVDNSGSIDDAEFLEFQAIIEESLEGICATCPSSNRGIVHYGGSFGKETMIEYPLGQADEFSKVNRQFCLDRFPGGVCIGGGGDDLNHAIGDIMMYIDNGMLNRNPANQLSLVIFTDAFGFEDTCTFSSCSQILPLTNIDFMKANYGVDVSVVGISSQATSTLLALYASPGGSYVGGLDEDYCPGSFDGCIDPRKYVKVLFNTPPSNVADMITDFVFCSVSVEPPIFVDAGPDVSICGNFGESTDLTVSASMGTFPYLYMWSDSAMSTTKTITVSPSVTTTYYVTVVDANDCSALDSVVVNVRTCDDCDADAGTPRPPMEHCMINGQALLPAQTNDGLSIPTDFEVVYILTNSDLIILDYSIGTKNFLVREEGLYRIHTLVAEVNNPFSEDYLDLNIIKIGESNLFIVGNCIIDHDICADLDYPGRVHQVFGPNDMMCMTQENSINLCWDGIDNDGDGLIDCADPDCQELIVCQENTLIACNDLTDNDRDGLVDCYDSDCFQFTVCFERGDQCRDGLDNDGDGLVDCADPSCGSSDWCEEDSPFTCLDGQDNDADGLIDCQEASCQRFIVCAEYSESACTDGLDNDYDGLVDCADGHCKQLLGDFCDPVENNWDKCNDGIDNDGDGLVDCVDPDCITQQLVDVENNLAVVIETENSTCPNNNNGIIRFVGIAQSPDFQYSVDGGLSFANQYEFGGLTVGPKDVVIKSLNGCELYVQVDIIGSLCIETCNNGVDDNADGLVDCNDPQCQGKPSPYNVQISNIVGTDCPYYNNGSFAISNMPQNVKYSINGINYQSLPQFSGLFDGVYNLYYKDPMGCYGPIQVVVPRATSDSDLDGICDPNDRCPGVNDFIIGSPCNDGDTCTINDTYDGSCNCVGIFQDADNDGICDVEDLCNGIDDNIIGTSCDDGNPCTAEDTWSVNCECIGVFQDADLDGVCDAEDICPDFDDNLLGAPCDDGDPCTVDDTYDNNCNCTGIFQDSDGDGVCDATDSCPGKDDSLIGTPCDDGNHCTLEDTWSVNCECIGVFQDADLDGICDAEDMCPGMDDSLTGSPCDDGDACTINDTYDINCNCIGTFQDTDGDSVCDAEDVCPSGDDTLRGMPCDDGDACTINDTYTVACNCVGLFQDSDGDGVCDANDRCPGTDDNNCFEACDNGMDDDGDGLVDCDDPDCIPNYSIEYSLLGSACDTATGRVEVTNPDPDYLYWLWPFGSNPNGIFENVPVGEYRLSALNRCDTVSAFNVSIAGINNCDNPGFSASKSAELVVSAILQGACDPETGSMTTELNAGGYLPGQEPVTFFGTATPAGQPFSEAPWFYEGQEGKVLKSNNKSDVPLYHPDVVDWVLVSLRTTREKPSEVWRGAALLYHDGSIEFFRPFAPQQFEKDGYYILLEHRNHLPVMSHEKVHVKEGKIEYDFTQQDSYTSILGIGQVQDAFGSFMMVAGNGELIVELSSDIDINVRDLSLWIQKNGANSSYFLEDYDMNGDINIKDRILWEKNNGLFTTLQTK